MNIIVPNLNAIKLNRNSSFTKILLLLFFTWCCYSPLSANEHSIIPNCKATKLTDNNHFQVTYSSNLKPIEINRIHNWIIHIEDSHHYPISNANILLNGSMPEHEHGLPTQPRVTQYLGNGDYLVEGMKFHMGGQWIVTISVSDSTNSDKASFKLTL